MSEFTRANSRAIPLPGLTVEIALYGALVLIGLGARVAALGDAPLNAEEARQAMAAWNFARGTPDAFTGSPLLFAGNTLLFLLFGANETTARLLPALFGTALIALPALLRRELGRPGALIASALFVFSPSLVLFARTAHGTLIAVTCAFAAFAFGWRYLNERVPRELNFAALCAALAVLAAREVWTIALAFAVFAVLARALGLLAPQDAKLDMRNALLLFVGIVVSVATLFLFRREGLGATFDLLGTWLEGLTPGLAFYDPLRLLVIYDPIPLFLGVAGLIALGFVAMDEHARAFFNALALWIIVAFVLYSLGADKHPARVSVLVVPLALIAGWYVGGWLERAVQETDREFFLAQELPVFFFACVIGGFLYLLLAEFVTRGSILAASVLAALLGIERAPEFDGQVIVVLLLLSVVAIVFLTLATVGVQRARVIGLALVLSGLSLWTVRQTAFVNFPGGIGLNPREYLIARAASPNVRDLERDVRDAGRWRANDATTLALVADETLNPIVAWTVRDFRNVRLMARPTLAPDTQAVLLAARAPAPARNWIGQTYTLEATRATSLQPSAFLRWLFFRDTGGIEISDATLWLPPPQ